MSRAAKCRLEVLEGTDMKNFSICLFVLGFSVVGCENKPAAKPATPPAAATTDAAAAAAAAADAAGKTDAPAAEKTDAPAAEKKE